MKPFWFTLSVSILLWDFALAECGDLLECNGQCYDSSSYDCVKDIFYWDTNILCPKGYSSCKWACFSPDSYHCRVERGGVLASGPGCGTGLSECNDNECFQEGEYTCLSVGREKSYTLCPTGHSACNGACFDYLNYECVNNSYIIQASPFVYVPEERTSGWEFYPECQFSDGKWMVIQDFEGPWYRSPRYSMVHEYSETPCTLIYNIRGAQDQTIPWKAVVYLSNGTSIYFGCQGNGTFIQSPVYSAVPNCTFTTPPSGSGAMAINIYNFTMFTLDVSPKYRTLVEEDSLFTLGAFDGTPICWPTRTENLDHINLRKPFVFLSNFITTLYAINGTVYTSYVINKGIGGAHRWIIEPFNDNTTGCRYRMRNTVTQSYLNSNLTFTTNCTQSTCLWDIYTRKEINEGDNMFFVNVLTNQTITHPETRHIFDTSVINVTMNIDYHYNQKWEPDRHSTY